MNRRLLVKCLVLGIVVSSVVFASSLKAESVVKIMSGERELLPKIWVPDPEGASRESADIGDWYDPPKNPALMTPGFMTMFKTAAVWNAPELGDVVLRILDDDEVPLMNQLAFVRNVKRVVGMRVPIFVNKASRAEPKLTMLSGVGSITYDAVSIHVKIDNANQFTGGGDSELLSKRYLNVDGRFFYIAVRSRLWRKKNVFACAKANENFLNAWERDIRRCTAEHRLAEHGGDAKAAENAIAQELLADKTKLQNSSKYGPTFDERLESALAERGYNSTNKPSPEVRKEIVNKLLKEDAKRMLDRIDADKKRDKVETPVRTSLSMDGNASKGRRTRVRGVGGLIAEALPIPDKGKGSIAVCLFAFFSAIFIIVALVNIFARTPGGHRHLFSKHGDNGGKAISKSKEPDKNHCWICGAPCHDYDSHPIKMWGNHESRAERGWGGRKVHHTWNTVEIDIPCCVECEEEIEESTSVRNKVSAIAGLSVFAVVGGGVFLLYRGPDIDDRLCWSMVSAFLSGVFVMVLGFAKARHKYWRRIVEFPVIVALLGKGWKFGSKPTSVD